jgi:predicted metal-binding membrane protein
MPVTQSWGVVELGLLFVMWVVMMVAMMVPAVAPLVLMFAWVHRQKGGQRVVGPAGTLLVGYLIVWTGFSLVATLVQWGLHSTALLSSLMVTTSSIFGGLVLVVVGAFQFTPLKRACLAHCRSPLGFLVSDWRKGQWGAFVMGLKHAAYCVGCCWMLMALLFVAGVMNLLWMVGIAVLIFVEKAAPSGDVIGRIAGGTLIVVGIALIAG